MTRRVRELQDLEIDEISLVDKGANQHARTVIAKRHDEEVKMEDYFDEDGDLVDVASLAVGDVVYDEAGNAFEASADDDDDDYEYDDNPFARQEEREFQTVGKSYDLREEFSKAMSDADRDEVIAKAFDTMDEYELIAKRAEYAAETERQIRLDREYTEIAKSYNVGVDPEELGPVLKRLAENLSYEDCVVIAKGLGSGSAANELFDEIGASGSGSNSNVFDSVEAQINSRVAKGDTSVTREDAISKAFDDDPDAYEDYLREQASYR